MTISQISAYIEARDVLNRTNYIEQRNELRESFLSTERGVDFESNLREKISSLPDRVQAEAISRYAEWMFKLQIGKLTESTKTVHAEDFINQFVEFYRHYSDLIEDPIFETANKTRSALRDLFFTARETLSTDQIIEDWLVTDPELQNRMRNEWDAKFSKRL